jgi:hypothetical protein
MYMYKHIYVRTCICTNMYIHKHVYVQTCICTCNLQNKRSMTALKSYLTTFNDV